MTSDRRPPSAADTKVGLAALLFLLLFLGLVLPTGIILWREALGL